MTLNLDVLKLWACLALTVFAHAVAGSSEHGPCTQTLDSGTLDWDLFIFSRFRATGLDKHYDEAAPPDPTDPSIAADLEAFISGSDTHDLSVAFATWCEVLARVRVQDWALRHACFNILPLSLRVSLPLSLARRICRPS